MQKKRALYYRTYDAELIRVEKGKKPVYLISWGPSFEAQQVRKELLGVLERGEKRGLSDYFYLDEELVRELLDKASGFECKVSRC